MKVTVGSFFPRVFGWFKSGLFVSLLIIILGTLMRAILDLFEVPSAYVSDNLVVQFIVTVVFVIVLGIMYRITKRHTPLIMEFMPTASLEKPVVTWETAPGSGIYQTGIHMGNATWRIGSGIQVMARIMVATGGPTSAGGIQELYVPLERTRQLNRSGGEAIATLMALGARGGTEDSDVF